jgi:hypothetical protein
MLVDADLPTRRLFEAFVEAAAEYTRRSVIGV